VGQGAWQFGVEAVEGVWALPQTAPVPQTLAQLRQFLIEAAKDPQGKKEAVLTALEKMPAELKAWAQAQPDLIGLYTLYGQYDKAAQRITRGGLEVVSLAAGVGAVVKAAKGAKHAAKTYIPLGEKAAKTAATIEKSALQKALAAAKPTSGHPTQLMTTLEDGTRVIFRKDFGAQAHTIGGPFQGMGKVDHYNIEIQSAAGKRIENIHAVPDESGGFTFWGKEGIIK